MLTPGTKTIMLGEWPKASQSMLRGLLGVPKTFSEVRTIFRMTQRQYFFCADISTDGAKAIVGQLLAPWQLIKAVGANETHSHCILHHTLAVKKKFPLWKSLKKQAVRVMTFINLDPWAPVFLMFSATKQKAHIKHSAAHWCKMAVQKKSIHVTEWQLN